MSGWDRILGAGLGHQINTGLALPEAVPSGSAPGVGRGRAGSPLLASLALGPIGKRDADGATGWDIFSGFLGDNGQAVIVGYGLMDGGGSFRIYYHGTLVNGHLMASGKHGSRDCTLDYLLVPTR